MPVLVLDFDGVLAIPWTDPVKIFPQIPALLERLSKKHTLALASFNPTAIAELRKNELLQYFTVTRAGTHENREITEFITDLGPLCKAAQIHSIGTEHLPTVDWSDFYFFDDDAHNLANVFRRLPQVHLTLVESNHGLTQEMLADLL